MKHKITIPEPCHENWDKMMPNENGRFCMSCSKTVIDFSYMMPEEIQHFFIQNQNEKICGRFKKSQLETITIQIPSRVLYTQNQYPKMFLLALFIAMGTTLFSCQDRDGNKRKIDTIEVVDSNKNQNEKLEQIPPPPPPPVREKNANQENAVKFNKMVSGEVVPEIQKTKESNFKNKETTIYSSTEKTTCQETSKQDAIAEEELYIMGGTIETKPNYPGGNEGFYQYFIDEFKLPETAEKPKSRILVSFVIEKDGSLSSFDFSKNTDPKISDEIARVLKQAPKWESGTQNGKKTRTKYSMPISIE